VAQQVAQAMATHQAAMQQWAAMQVADDRTHASMHANFSEWSTDAPPPVMPPMPTLMMLPPPTAGSPAVSYLTSFFFHFEH
jgi:hypothetical protein